MKKVLVISSSPRRQGNSELLCDQFIKGAVEAHHEVEKVNLNDYQIAPCQACEYCRHHDNICHIKDDANLIIDKMIKADVIALASPVYFYSVSAQLKLLIDRTFAREYEIRESQKQKLAYFIITSGSLDQSQMFATIETMRGFIKVMRTIKEAGIVYGLGVMKRKEIINHECYNEAYIMGKNI